MDVIGDTSMAVRAYSSQEDTNDKGRLYLETYGVLQALQVRQDAIFDLCDVLGSNRNKGDFPGLEDLRSARKSIAGHPTKRQREGEGPREGPHHLVQTSLHRNSLQLMSFSPGGPKFTHINLDALIRKQESELGQILGGLITDLKDAEAKHKAQFLGRKVGAVFPGTLGYSFEKIYEHIGGSHLAGLGPWGLDEVSRTLDEYRRALEARGIQLDTYDSIKCHFELLAYPVEQLRAYLQGKGSEISGSRAAKIFAYFIEGHINELRMIAREIDRDFSS